MAGPILRPDNAPSRAEPAASRAAAQPHPALEKDSFERVQQGVVKANRSSKRAETGESEAPAGARDKVAAAEKNESKAKTQSNESPLVRNAVKASVDEASEVPSIDLTQLEAKTADEDVAAAFLPVAQPIEYGKTLPSANTASGSQPLAMIGSANDGEPGMPGLRQLFMQMAQAGKGTEEGGEPDLQSFKSSLTEVLDSRGSRSMEAPALTMTNNQRGMELRDGSALVRQYSTTIETPLQQGDWGDKVAGKISWLAGQGISFAEIHINPPDMGPIDVRVSVQNDQATVAVHAQNSSVRDLLELNGHRLREMMQDNGLNLAKMDVSDQPAHEQQQAAGGEAGKGGRNSDGEGEGAGMVSVDGEAISTGEIHLQWQNQVDTYA